jgi:hypothetical protein
MPILNYTTTIDVEKTMGEINRALARRGVTRISTLYDEHGVAAGLAFTMKADPAVKPAQKNAAQAARVAWRIAKDWLEAQAALIDAQLATLDEVMLPYMVDGTGQTMYAVYRSTQKAIGA